MNLKEMLDDQKAFNRLVWDRDRFKGNESALMERLRVLGLGAIEESLEFLRTFEYKVHRRSKLRLQNVAHSHEELIDMFKYWLSLVDLTDFPIEDLEKMYYAKSRVVQYRYQEEWVKTIDGPCVVVDIDQVLGDYITAICRWGREYGSKLMRLSSSETIRVVQRLEEIQVRQSFVNADTVGVGHLQWQAVKHDFRTRGGKRTLNVFPDARPFLEWCKTKGWTIILVTSRPVTEYPNIFTDTLYWLNANQLPFDRLWWSFEKGERLEEASLRSQVVFAVDDSPKHVTQFREKGIKAYQLSRTMGFDDSDPTHNPFEVRSLHDLMARENHAMENSNVL